MDQPARWQKVKSLFLEAVDLQPQERNAFLAESCRGDAELREEVERLIRQHEALPSTQLLDPNSQPRRTFVEGELLSGRFRILRFVGFGGMGEVYRAADLELGGEVALKTLRPDLLSDSHFLDRFRREVTLARQVTHPNVCRIFDVGHHQTEDKTVVFLTMEFLEGETLSAKLRRDGRISPEVALSLAKQIADGLTALHQRGIVHRDLKPGNIMVVQPQGSQQARAVITDFGLAKTTESGPGEPMSQSGPSQVLGTPDYMAPEQMLGKLVTPAADIYAFGLVLLEMVTGKKAASVRECLPQLNKNWDKAIQWCLALAPEERPQSAAEVVKAIEGSAVQPHLKLQNETKRGAWVLAIAMIVLLSLTAIWRFAGSKSAHSPQRVAVLGFNVIGGDPALRMFADGLVESITSRLSQYEGPSARLMVVPASEVRRQGTKTASDARKLFNADGVVEGSVQAQGNRVRLMMTVVDTGESSQTETVVVEDQLDNAFNLQDAAVERLAKQLKLRVRAEYAQEAKNLAPVAPGAYEYYLQARGYLQRGDQMASIQSAATLLKRAIDLDPKFALAHSGLAQSYFYEFKFTRDPKTLEAALASGNRALSLNPDSAETNIAMGQIYYGTGRNDEARQSFVKAIAADPRNHEAFQGLAQAYLGLKDYAKAEETYRKAIAMRPSDWTGYKALALYYYEREDFRRAAEQFQKVVELAPDNAQGYLNLGAAKAGLEDRDGAEKAWLRSLELEPKSAGTLSNLGKLYFDRNDNVRAIEMFRKSLDLNNRNYRTWGLLARAFRRIGDQPKSKDALEKTIEMLDAEIKLNPARSTIYSSLGFYRALAGRKDFEAPLARALELSPDTHDTMERVAEAYAVAGNRQRAIEYLAKAIVRGATKASIERSEFLRELPPVKDAK